MSFIDGDYELDEGQRLEFKEASSGLPDDIWETYSAFANTEGGEIVLGVSEDKASGAFVPVGVSDPAALELSFWTNVRNPSKVSRDIMPADGAVKVERDGKAFLVLRVPRAERDQKPVTVSARARKGMSAWVRRGSGDFLADEDDLALMRYDAERSADRGPLERFGIDALDPSTVVRYRRLFASLRPSSPWVADSDEDFLYHVGAAAKGRDGAMRPTRAGLLAFGREYEITNLLPSYLLDYRVEAGGPRRWEDRLVSQSGDWSGNLVDFYLMVSSRLSSALPAPFSTDSRGLRHGSANRVLEAANEAVVNALVHAHYGTRSSITVVLGGGALEVVNPGTLLVDREVALAGGVSEARNPTLMRIMALIGAGDRAGSGIPTIWDAWGTEFHEEPRLIESHAPASVKLSLPLPAGGRRAPAGPGGLLGLLSSRPEGVTAAEAAEALGVSDKTSRRRLEALLGEGAVSRVKDGRSFRYSLRAAAREG